MHISWCDESVTKVGELMDPSATLEVKAGVMDDFVQNVSQKKTGLEILS